MVISLLIVVLVAGHLVIILLIVLVVVREGVHEFALEEPDVAEVTRSAARTELSHP
jgi:hypothetical protein